MNSRNLLIKVDIRRELVQGIGFRSSMTVPNNIGAALEFRSLRFTSFKHVTLFFPLGIEKFNPHVFLQFVHGYLLTTNGTSGHRWFGALRADWRERNKEITIQPEYQTKDSVGTFQPEELEHLVHQLLKCGCRKLKMLRINLSQLGIRVIDLLANSFRELTRLTIIIDENRNPGEFSISSACYYNCVFALPSISYFRLWKQILLYAIISPGRWTTSEFDAADLRLIGTS